MRLPDDDRPVYGPSEIRVGGRTFWTPWERHFPRLPTVALFERIAGAYARTVEGVKDALWKDPTLRDMAQGREHSAPGFGADLLTWGYAWHVLGRHAYLVTRGLLEALLATDLTHAPAEAACAPHPMFAILFEVDSGPRIPLKTILDPDTHVPLAPSTARARGIFVCDDALLRFACGTPDLLQHHAFEGYRYNEAGEIHPDDLQALRADSDKVAAERPHSIGFVAHVETDDRTHWWTDKDALDLVDPDLEVSLQSTRERRDDAWRWYFERLDARTDRGKRTVAAMRNAMSAPPAEEDPLSAQILLGLALRVILYVNSAGAAQQPIPYSDHPPRRSGKARAIQGRLRRLWGKPVLLGADVPELAAGAESGDEHHLAPRLHLVRGHMRWQAHGPQWSLRKLIWIAPFWRGLDNFGGNVERRYAPSPPTS